MTLSKLFLGILIFLLVLLQISLWGENGLPKYWDLKNRAEAQRIENEQLKEQNQRLTQEVLDLKSKAVVIEEIAREELGMIKEEEVFYRVIQQQEPEQE